MAKTLTQITDLEISHVFVEELPVRGLRNSEFFTTDGEFFYNGYDTGRAFTHSELLSDIYSGFLIPVKASVKADLKKDVWYNAKGEYFLADMDNPFEGQEEIPLDR